MQDVHICPYQYVFDMHQCTYHVQFNIAQIWGGSPVVIHMQFPVKVKMAKSFSVQTSSMQPIVTP